MNILKVDCLWTTNMVQIRLLKKMAADKKIAYIGVYQLILIVLNLFICYKCLHLSVYLYIIKL